MSKNNIYYRVFVFSQTQQDKLIDLEKSRGNVAPVFGRVTVRGSQKTYTDILRSREDIRYPDSRVLIEGDIRTIKYTESTMGK